MQKKIIAYLAVAIAAFGMSAAQGAPVHSNKERFAEAVSVLRAQIPKFDWQASTAISVDINADGIEDVAVLGYTEKTAAVGVVLGQKGAGKPNALYIDFMRGDPSVERSMNGRNGTLKAWKQDETPKAALSELPKGYQICDRCYQVEVVGDEDSDPITIYWNTVIQALDWWRP